MADLRISQLPELQQGNLAQDDVLAVTDVSASETKKIRSKNLIQDGIENLPAGAIPGDKVTFTNIDGNGILDGTIDGEAKLKDGSVTTEKLANEAVTEEKLADFSGTKIKVGTMPANRLDESTLNRSIDLDDSGNLGIANEIPAATMSGITYNEQGLITDAVPLVGSDLPLATETTVGAIAVPPSSGLTVSATGDIDHKTLITPTTVSGISVDEHGHVNSIVPLVGSDLPPATGDELGAIQVPDGGNLEVDNNGNLIHSPSGAGTGPFTKVTLDAAGHVIGGSGLDDTDIPGLDASKIISGQFPTERIGDDAITSTKLSDYSTCLMQEDNPGAGDFLGQFWFTPSTAQLRVYARGSGPESIWVPVGFGSLQANNLRWGGSYDADTDTITVVTSIGISSGVIAGQPFPAPSDELSGLYFICQTPGNSMTQNNLQNISHTAGDWALCVDGAQGWIHIDANAASGGGGGSAQYLNDLLDVEIGGAASPFSTAPAVSLSGDQLLRYDGGAGLWRNTDILDGGSID